MTSISVLPIVRRSVRAVLFDDDARLVTIKRTGSPRQSWRPDQLVSDCCAGVGGRAVEPLLVLGRRSVPAERM